MTQTISAEQTELFEVPEGLVDPAAELEQDEQAAAQALNDIFEEGGVEIFDPETGESYIS